MRAAIRVCGLHAYMLTRFTSGYCRRHKVVPALAGTVSRMPVQFIANTFKAKSELWFAVLGSSNRTLILPCLNVCHARVRLFLRGLSKPSHGIAFIQSLITGDVPI